jgi:hypothetical protein
MFHGGPDDAVTVSFAVENRETAGGTTRLFSETVTLTAGRPEVRLPFHVSPGGRPVALSITVPSDQAHQVLGGWRDIRIGHATDTAAGPPALLRALLSADGAGHHPTAAPVLRLAGLEAAADDGWVAAPFEVWQPVSPDRRDAAVAVEVQRRPDGAGHPTLLTLAWYKAGRVEFLRQEVANPAETTRIELSAGLPEAGGWVGLLARAADPAAEPNVRARPPEWR